MSKNKIIVTEQVSKYHPDKYADQISDYIVEKAKIVNPNAKCAIEVLVKDDTVVLAGELSGVEFSIPHYEKMVLDVADDLNYTVDKVINLISEQSAEINQAVIHEKDKGLKEQFILLRGGGRTKRVTIKSLIKDFKLSPSQAKDFYNFLIKYKQIH